MTQQLRLPSFEIIKFCAEEVTRQQDTPEMVYHMIVAWMVAVDKQTAGVPLDVPLIKSLGRLVHPQANAGGFRRVDVRVGRQLCPPWQEVPQLMQTVVDGFTRLSPDESYLAFERCHPFRDGNGRCGKIILAWLSDHLDNPNEMKVPNPWGISNP